MTVEELEIQIRDNSESAVDGLEKLRASLERLKTATKGDAGLSAVSRQISSLTGNLGVMPATVQRAAQSMQQVSEKASSGAKKIGLFGGGALGASLKLGAMVLVVKRLASALSDVIEQSNKYIENLNLFTVSMGNSAKQAQGFAEMVGVIMGIDPSDWMRNQGIFNTLATGFGVSADRAALMSKNLTQLGYDISSFFNISIEDSMQKLQSGISGELEPLRRLGYDLSQARLEATALALGIDQSVSSMNQAQKAQLRYYAIMTQVTQVQGDMARTLSSPANQLRILQASFTQCARAIGNIFIPILNAVIPVAIAVVKVITMAANAIASLFGFSLPTVDYSGVSSGLGNITSGAEDAADAMSGATDAAKALKRATVGMDELNILQTNQNASGGSGGAGVGGGGDFDFELPEYDFLADLVKTKTDEMVEKIQEMGKRLQSVFQPAIDKAKELFGILGGQAAQFDWAKQLGDTFWALAEAVSSAGELILSVLNPVIEALNIPEVVFSGLETLESLLNAIDDILDSLIPGLDLFSKNGLAPIAKSMNSTMMDGMEHLRGLFDDLGKWFKDNEGALTELMSELGRTVGELWKSFEPFQQAVVSLFWSETEREIGKLGKTVSDSLPPITYALKSFNDALEKLNSSGFFQSEAQVWKDIFAVVKGVLTLDFEGHFDRMGKLGKDLGAFFGTLRTNAETLISKTFPNLWSAISDGDGAKGIIIGILRDIRDVFSSIGQAVENYLGYVSEKFGECVTAIQEFFSPLTDWFRDTVWNPIVELFSPISETIGGFFSDAWNAIVGVWNAVSGWFSTNIFDPLSKLFSEIRRVATEFFTQAWTNIKIVWAIVSWWFDTNIWSPIKNAVAAVTSTIGTFFSNAWNTVSGVWRAVSNWFTSTVITPLKNAFSAGLNKIKDIFVNLWSDIRSVFKSVYSWFTSNVVNPIRNAFKAVANGVIGAINGMIRGLNSIRINIPSAVKSLLGLSQGYIGFNIGYIPYYAKGGFPETGQLFMARENGIPEMVGQMGGRTAVANNEQIVDGIRRGVYEAQMEQNALLREEISLLKQLLAKESTTVAQVTTSDIVNGISRKNRRDGRVVVPVGT